MPGIGITLDDLGIDSQTTPSPAPKQPEYPKVYDFTLHRALFGSWWHVRDALTQELHYAYDDTPSGTPLRLLVLWAVREEDTEESIEAALTGMDYDQIVHDHMDMHLYNWAAGVHDDEWIRRMVAPGMPHQQIVRQGLARNRETPQDMFPEFARDPELHVELLENPALPEDVVRSLYEATKEENPHAFADFPGWVPGDILQSIVTDVLAEYSGSGFDFDPSLDYYLRVVTERPSVQEQTLIEMFGKLHYRPILKSPACTEKVRAEFERLKPSGGALLPGDKERAYWDLRRVQRSIETGKTSGIKRRKGVELALMNAVLANPGINLHEVYCIIEDHEVV